MPERSYESLVGETPDEINYSSSLFRHANEFAW